MFNFGTRRPWVQVPQPGPKPPVFITKTGGFDLFFSVAMHSPYSIATIILAKIPIQKCKVILNLFIMNGQKCIIRMCNTTLIGPI